MYPFNVIIKRVHFTEMTVQGRTKKNVLIKRVSGLQCVGISDIILDFFVRQVICQGRMLEGTL